MPKRLDPFHAEQFTATPYSTAEEKAAMANKLAAFIAADMPRHQWTARLYNALYLHLFGHIAHFNQAGFYGEWFETPADRLHWVQYALDDVSAGSPSHTWIDVGRALQRWLRDGAYLNHFRAAAQDQQRRKTVYTNAKRLASLDPCLTPGSVEKYVQEVRRQVEETTRLAFNPQWTIEIREQIVAELLTAAKTFRLLAISNNANSFGLNAYVWAAEDGECWQTHANQTYHSYKTGQDVSVALQDGVPQWSWLGFECPERRSNLPSKVVREAFAG